MMTSPGQDLLLQNLPDKHFRPSRRLLLAMTFLAESARRFRFLAPAPSSSPMQTLHLGMTGHHSGKVLMWNAVSGGLPTNETTFARILKEQGYSTGILGKWHLGINCKSTDDFCHHPLNHGFDYFYGTPLTLLNDCEVSRPSEMNVFEKLLQAQIFLITSLTLIVGKIWKFINIPWKILLICTFTCSLYFMYLFIAYGFMLYWNCILMRNYEIVEQPMDLDKKAGQIVTEAKTFINRNKDRPFLLFVSFLHIHTPHYTTMEFRGRSKHDLYGDNIEEMDWMLGGKGMGGLEGGIRVPGILRWPSVLPANTVIDKPTSLMDIYTTVVKLGGGMPPKDRIIDGKDMMPLLQGFVSNSAHEFMFHYCEEYLHAVRWQQTSSETVWKVHYISPKFSPEGAGACYDSQLCACGGEKVIYHVPPLLYNLSNDPSEKNPLPNDSELYTEVLRTIQEAVVRHNATLHPVPQQLYGLNNLWDPWLQPCCGTFPFCWCNKETD